LFHPVREALPMNHVVRAAMRLQVQPALRLLRMTPFQAWAA
jgi:hypothetical protein